MQKRGLGFPDLKTFISAYKLTWIRKFKNGKHTWKNIATVKYPFVNNIECYGPKAANTYPKQNVFWTQVVYAYEELYNKTRPMNIGEVLTEPIYFNERIIFGNMFLGHTRWIAKGIFSY